jgi:AraC-like DNA-binding protein
VNASPSTLEYHVLVNALEGRAGWTPLARFASAAASVINGNLPYQRYHAAGKTRIQEGSGEGVIERMVNDWMATDLNPAVHLSRHLKLSINGIRAYNAYYSSAKVDVRRNATMVLLGHQGYPRVVAKRDLFVNGTDPEPCRIATLVLMDSLMSVIHRNANRDLSKGPASLSRVARFLGVERSAAAEVSLVFESEGHVAISHVAQRIGCHQRRLERRLRQEGVTADTLRQASRLIRATNRLRSTDSLTTIAVDEGFSDLAHMGILKQTT